MRFDVTVTPAAGLPDNPEPQIKAARYHILVSALGNRLLFRRFQGSVEDTWIYDGQSLSACSSNSTLAQIFPGFTPGSVSDFLFPAVGVPYIAFLGPVNRADQVRLGDYTINGSVAHAGNTGRPIVYIPATIRTGLFGGRPVILGSISAYQGALIDQWRFSDFVPFEGIAVARRSEHVTYGAQPNTERGDSATNLKTSPSCSYVYLLESIRQSPLPESSYDFRTYLSQGANVNDYRHGTTAGLIQAFGYDSKGGSIENQETKQRILDEDAVGMPTAATFSHIHKAAPLP